LKELDERVAERDQLKEQLMAALRDNEELRGQLDEREDSARRTKELQGERMELSKLEGESHKDREIAELKQKVQEYE
jgi:hypothetical protein